MNFEFERKLENNIILLEPVPNAIINDLISDGTSLAIKDTMPVSFTYNGKKYVIRDDALIRFVFEDNHLPF